MNINELNEFVDREKVYILEDNCESLGAKIESKRAGTFGIMSSHSFFFSHHISTMEGGIFQGTSNDDVLMGPGIARGGSNQGLSKEDVSAIATAVRDGASSAQINLDGGRVSNRIQPPLAMNTRKYSV